MSYSNEFSNVSLKKNTYFVKEVFEMGVVESFTFHVADGVGVDDLIAKCTDGHVRSLWDVEQFTSMWFGYRSTV